jgi:hypothetical protein
MCIGNCQSWSPGDPIHRRSEKGMWTVDPLSFTSSPVQCSMMFLMCEKGNLQSSRASKFQGSR